MLLLGAAVLVVFLIAGGVAPSRASAEWRLVECAPKTPCYQWFENGVATVKKVTVSAFERMTAAQAGAEANAGVTGQSAASFGSQAEKDAAAVATDVVDAGTSAEGSLVGAASDTGFLPALSTLGAVANAAGSFYLGWQIGTEINDLIIDPRTESKSAGVVAMVGESFRAKGDILVGLSDEHGTVQALAPSPGAQVKLGEKEGTSLYESINEVKNCENTEANHGIRAGGGQTVVQPAGGIAVWSAWLLLNGAKNTCEERVGSYFLHPKADVKGGFKGKETKSGTAPAPVATADALKKAKEHLQDPELDSETKVWSGDHSITGPTLSGAEEVEVPLAGEHESFEAYDSVLYDAGLQPEPLVVAESAIDTSKGPNEVTDVAPAPGTKVKAGSTVRVRYNPADAPEPVGGSWSPPTIPSIDLSPLKVPIACNNFPFGIFCWIYGGLTSWGGSGTCPSFAIPIHTGELEVDFCQFEPAMEIIRPVLVVLAVFTLAVVFAYAALGIGGSEGSDD